MLKKLRGTILVHFGLMTFRFAYGRTPKPSFLCFWDFWTCPRAPKSIILMFEDPRILKQNKEKQFIFKNLILINLKVLDIQHFDFFRKDGRWKSRSPNITISWKSWIWDQYIPANMKWHFGNMGSVCSKTINEFWIDELWNFLNFETLKLRNVETKKLWSQETKKPRSQ